MYIYIYIYTGVYIHTHTRAHPLCCPLVDKEGAGSDLSGEKVDAVQSEGGVIHRQPNFLGGTS